MGNREQRSLRSSATVHRHLPTQCQRPGPLFEQFASRARTVTHNTLCGGKGGKGLARSVRHFCAVDLYLAWPSDTVDFELAESSACILVM